MNFFDTPFRKFNLPQTENKLLKASIYNCLTFLIITVIVATLASVYYIFNVFLSPLIWAVLVGTCVFPFKRYLTLTIQGWIKGLENQKCTLAVGTAVLPINLTLLLGDLISEVFRKQLKFIFLYVLGLPALYYIYNIGIVSYTFSTLSAFYNFTSNLFGSRITSTLVFTSVIIFVTFVYVDKNENKKLKKFISSMIWLIIIIHFSSLTGSLGLFVFSGILFLLFIGLMMDNSSVATFKLSNIDLLNIWEFLTSHFRTSVTKISEEDDRIITLTDESTNSEDVGSSVDIGNSTFSSTPLRSESTENKESNSFFYWISQIKSLFSTSPIKLNRSVSRMISSTRNKNRSSYEKKFVDKIMLFLFWSHFIVLSGRNPWFMLLIGIAALYYVIKKLWRKLEVSNAISSAANSLWDNYIGEWIKEKSDILFPQFVRALFRSTIQLDEKIRGILLRNLDDLVSVFVIFAMILATLVLTIFLASQVHNESLHLIALTTNVLNSTVSSEWFSWLPKRQDISPLIDTVTQNVYKFGREWISKKVDQMFDTNSFNKARIEESALELWEKLYERIVQSNGTNSTLAYNLEKMQKPGLNRQLSINSLHKNMANIWDLVSTVDVLDFGKISNFVRENLGILSTVLESVWVLLRSNINLALSLFTTILSAIFGGGTFILNFFVSLIIFLTALFYLLASSRDRYLPMAALHDLVTPSGARGTVQTIYDSVEHGISSVFSVTLKMACFYGLYTSLTHTMFSVNLVFIPAITAAIVACVPIVGTYVAALPAITELIFVNQDYLAASILFLLHLLPAATVDAFIYSEIKETGHPYLTGLAIAGGVYWLGLEGAVVGPLMLCFCVILINIAKMLLQDPSTNVDKATSSNNVYSNDKFSPIHYGTSQDHQKPARVLKSKSVDKSADGADDVLDS